MLEWISGCILAGGKSSRYGSDKAMIHIAGIPAILRLYRMMKNIFHEVFVIANDADKYAFLGSPVYPDIHRHIGPLGGIHSALIHSSAESVFVLSCDLPLITENLIQFLAAYPSKKSIVLPVTAGIIQPLCGIYRRSCLPLIDQMIGPEPLMENPEKPKQWKYSPLILIDMAGAHQIEMETEYPLYQEQLFYNINHPEDAEKIKMLLEKANQNFPIE